MSADKQRFLYVTDIHNRSEKDQPKNRTDVYYRSVLKKQEEIGRIIQEQQVDCLLFGGDLFHHFDPPMGLVNDVASIWKQYDVEAIIGVIGSHDYNGYQVQTLRRTGIGNLAVHDLIHLVGNDGSMFPTQLSFGGAFITGTPHSAKLADLPSNFATTKQLEHIVNTVVIQLVHGDLFPEHVLWDHQTIQAVHPYITADMVLSGHIHCGWENTIQKENPRALSKLTSYVNPGSIGRTSTGKARTIKVFMFDVVYGAAVQRCAIVNQRYIPLQDVVADPFREKSEVPEGAPVADFTELMKMISSLELRPSEFKTHVPRIVEQICGGTPYVQVVTDRIFEALDQQEKSA